LAQPEDQFDVLLETLRPCLRHAWIPGAAAVRMHIFADELRPKGERQLTLFEGASERPKTLQTLRKSINEKAGRFPIRSGAKRPLDHVYADRANEWDICDARGKTCF
jgi:hypothetical protein